MIKLRKIDKSTKHLRGRIVFSDDKAVVFPSSETMFLRKLEEKILMSCKGFTHSGIKLEHFDLKIK